MSRFSTISILFLQRLHDRQIGLHRERHIGRKNESPLTWPHPDA